MPASSLRIEMNEQKKQIVSYQDFNKICRFCFKKSISLKPIFNVTNNEEEMSMQVVDQVIRECLNLLVYMDDGLPEQICNVCLKKLFDFHDFWQLCHSATEFLNRIHQSKNDKIDVKEEYDVDLYTELCGSKFVKVEEASTNAELSQPQAITLTTLQMNKTSSPSKVSKMKRKRSSKRSLIPAEDVECKKRKEKKSDLEICPICGITLRCLTQHIKTHFQEKNLNICDICGFSTVQKSNLQRHMHVTHVKEGEYMCKICLALFTDLRQLNRHKKIKHQERKHPCPNCKAIFHTSFGLTKHRTIHSGERKHVCEECGKSYRMLDSLKAHRKRHLNPTIPCTYCAKLFYTKNELRSHVGLHTGVKAFKCDICTSAFIASSSLAAHRRKHKKENVLPTCDVCGTQFNDRVLLKMHLNDHKKDSPFD